MQNLENTSREEVEHHMAEIEEMRQMSKQEHENNTKMELFTLKVLPFIQILVPQMELLVIFCILFSELFFLIFLIWSKLEK